MTEAEFKAGLATLGVAFRAEVTPTMARVYFSALRDLSAEEWRAALERHVATSRFFPTIAELRDASGAQGRVGLQAARAFEQVLALGRHDVCVGTVFPRPERVGELVGAAAQEAYEQAGGSAAFARAVAADELTWVRKAFDAAFRESVQAGTALAPVPAHGTLPAGVAGMVAAGMAMPAPDYAAKRRDYRLAAARDLDGGET